MQVNDALDRVLQTVKDTESDIYETLKEDFGVDRARRHRSVAEQKEDIFRVNPADWATESLGFAKQAAQEGHDKDTLDGIVH